MNSGRSRMRRWLGHALAMPLNLRRVLPPRALARIGQAIAQAEAGHSGEICFAVEARLPWAMLWRNASARHRALAVFAEHRVWDTEHNNGVLIYLNLADRGVEIVADRGIAHKLAPGAWQQICHAMKEHCRAGAYEAGISEAVQAVGTVLRQHFALAPGEARVNELPDRPLQV